MKKEFGKYYLGLDVGTNSVGWAVTDEKYNVLKFNGKAMWGIRLFDEAQTAANTRVFRSQRRRIERQTWRLKLLQELFCVEMAKKDKSFFQRLAESNLQVDDKSADNKETFSLFGKEFLSDQEYYEKYPTIYHLRKDLLDNVSEAFDIRLVYLALAHMLKHRGHFLFADLNAENTEKFSDIYQQFIEYVQDNMPGMEEWVGGNSIDIEKVLCNKFLNISQKKKELEKLTNAKSKQEKALVDILSGATVQLSDLFADEKLKESEKKEVSFANDDFEIVAPILVVALNERFGLIEIAKGLYDNIRLKDILRGQKYLSYAKVQVFDEHKNDLILLKEFVKSKGKELYKEIFGIPQKSEAKNYSVYIGTCHNSHGKLVKIDRKFCTQAEFCKYLRGVLKPYVDFEQYKVLSEHASSFDNLMFKIQNDLAFPKQTSKANGVIPMQVNGKEMDVILQNAIKQLPFLAEQDENGLSVADKIKKIFEFRIPYYVGPLSGTAMSKSKKRCWCVRSSEKITPWNFDTVVDKTASAEKFIKNMTGKCTYLIGEDVLPQNSLLYMEFTARNELNKLKCNGLPLPIDVINKLYYTLIVMQGEKLTKKKIANFLKSVNFVDSKENIEITGVDDEIKASAKSYRDFISIFGKKYVDTHMEQIENIIKWITLFSDEKAMLKTKIHNVYPEIESINLTKICKLKYSGWGRLSATLLNGRDISYVDVSTGEVITLIEVMRRDNQNLMELLSENSKYGFAQKISEFNGKLQQGQMDKCSYAMVDEMYLSPSVKRAVWQTMGIVGELVKITGHAPKRTFVEVAREEGEKKRTKTRKEQLRELYKACKNLEPELIQQLNKLNEELEGKTDEELRSRKLFFYFLQLGKCMYTGKTIELSELYQKQGGVDVWDKDHIYPRSKTKDDSLDNLVLVHSTVNREKTDIYPLDPIIQQKMLPFWTMLKSKGLISATKFERLTRKSRLSNEELAGLINRQLVETRQSTKAIVTLLNTIYPNSMTVWSKASNISDFRQEFDFVKCRDVNDLHHAKDAYLNIVVGNAYHTKFTGNPYNFVKEYSAREPYTLKTKEMFEHIIQGNGSMAWAPGENGTIQTVRKWMGKNNILFTRMPVENKGQIFDVNPLSKGQGQVPLKQGMAVEKYGGYNSASTAYFALVRSLDKKGKQMTSVEAIPVYVAKDSEKVQQYLSENLSQPVILIPKICKNSLIKINGFNFHLTGVTSGSLTGSPASQLVLGKRWEDYARKICKVLGRVKKVEDLHIKEWDKITAEENLQLYDLLLLKHQTPIYFSRPSGQITCLQKGREIFQTLSLEQQCVCIKEILNLFLNKPLRANLSLIKGSKNAGVIVVNSKVGTGKEFKLYNQSITGLFEQEVDLTKL